MLRLVPSPDDRRRILGILLVIATAIQIGKGQRGLWVGRSSTDVPGAGSAGE